MENPHPPLLLQISSPSNPSAEGSREPPRSSRQVDKTPQQIYPGTERFLLVGRRQREQRKARSHDQAVYTTGRVLGFLTRCLAVERSVLKEHARVGAKYRSKQRNGPRSKASKPPRNTYVPDEIMKPISALNRSPIDGVREPSINQQRESIFPLGEIGLIKASSPYRDNYRAGEDRNMRTQKGAWPILTSRCLTWA